MEKKFTVNMLSEMIGKYLQIDGENTILVGYIKNISKKEEGIFDIELDYGSQILTEEQLLALYYKGQYNCRIFLYDSKQACLSQTMWVHPKDNEGTAISTETEHTTDIDVWKKRWWDLYSKLVVEYNEKWDKNEAVFVTNFHIERAMKEMDKFFKELKI